MPRASTSRPAFRDIAQASTLQHATRIFVFIGKTGGPGLTGTAGATCLAIRGEGIAGRGTAGVGQGFSQGLIIGGGTRRHARTGLATR